MRRTFARRALTCAALAASTLAVGCGHATASKPALTTPKPVLYVRSLQLFFCTIKTCPRAATEAQVRDARRHAMQSRLIRSARLVSAEAFEKAHPHGYAGIGLIPPYPDSLVLIPETVASAEKVADLFRGGDPKSGVAKVFYTYALH